MQTMMSKIEATVYPDPVLRDLDIDLRVYRPLARLRYSYFLHNYLTRRWEGIFGSGDIGKVVRWEGDVRAKEWRMLFWVAR